MLTDISLDHQVYPVLVDQLPTIWHIPSCGLLYVSVFSSDIVYSLFTKRTSNFGSLWTKEILSYVTTDKGNIWHAAITISTTYDLGNGCNYVVC